MTAPAGRPHNRAMRGSPVAAIASAAGLAAVAVGSVVDWVTFRVGFLGGGEELSFAGTKIAQGKALLVLGVLGAATSIFAVSAPAIRRVAGAIAISAASVAVAFAATNMVDVSRVPELNEIEFSFPSDLPTEFPTDFPFPFPTDFPFPFPTDFPTDFPFPFPTDIDASPAAAVSPAQQPEEQQGLGFEAEIALGLWLVLGGGILGLLGGLVLAFPRLGTQPAGGMVTAPEPPPQPPPGYST